MGTLEAAFGLILHWNVITTITIAAVFGLFVGAVPGLTATMAIVTIMTATITTAITGRWAAVALAAIMGPSTTATTTTTMVAITPETTTTTSRAAITARTAAAMASRSAPPMVVTTEAQTGLDTEQFGLRPLTWGPQARSYAS